MSLTVRDLFDYGQKVVTQEQYTRPPHPVEWICENFIDPISGTMMKLEPWQKRILRHALQIDDQGYSKYDLVIWSQPKKSGKTTIAAAVGAWVACNVEAPNEVSCVANDQEQSAGRIFGNMQPTLNRLNWSTPVSQKGLFRDPAFYGPNRSTVKAITTNYEKEAGGNQGISLWSELWAYKGERLTRLWEEMTPPPTRRFSMRWVETYAGFIGENVLLQDLYLKVFKDFEERELQSGVIKLWPDLPVYEVDGHMLVFWDHEHRMPWQTEEYYQKQQDNIRLSSFIRLHLNKWVESSDSFITLDMWNTSTKTRVPMHSCTFALDGSKNGACTALVGSYRDGIYVNTPEIYIWEPEENKDIDYQEVEEKVYQLYRTKALSPPLWYDPYQMAKMAQDLKRRGVPCQEFSQGQMRILSDTFLFKMYKQGKIRNVDDPRLRKHILAASTKDYENERIRIVKPDDSEQGHEKVVVKKVDAAVAQSMSVYKAYLKRSGGWGGSSQVLIIPKEEDEDI